MCFLPGINNRTAYKKFMHTRKDRKLKFEQAERRGAEEKKGRRALRWSSLPIVKWMHFYCNLFLPVLLLPDRLREAKDTRDVSDIIIIMMMIMMISIKFLVWWFRKSTSIRFSLACEKFCSNQIDAIFYGYYPHIAWLLSSYHLALCIEVKYWQLGVC